MRIIWYLIQKEFTQIFRNRIMIPILFVVPFIQLIILVNAATLEIKNTRMTIVDLDFSTTSKRLIEKFTNSPFFKVTEITLATHQANQLMQKGKTDIVMVIPAGFEKKIMKEKTDKIQIQINGINGVVAGISSAYIQNIMAQFSIEMAGTIIGNYTTHNNFSNIEVTFSHWFNPQLNYKNFMVPAILVILVTIIGMLLSGLNLVREKEMGTIEQINVTPIRKHQFIAGKLLPFWILAIIELSIGLTIGKLLYNIPIEGSLFTLFLFTSVYLAVVMALGLLISISSNTQQQTLFLMFFTILVSIMLSGIFTSVETMPNWAQWLNQLNPVFYFMKVVRMILLKGSTLNDLKYEFLILCSFAVLLVLFAVKRYRKSTI